MPTGRSSTAIVAACAIALRDRGALPGNTVVTTVMANLGFHHAMREAGIDVIATKVGDRYVLEDMLRTGRCSGTVRHVIFRDRAATGDGLLTALRFLSLATASGRSVRGGRLGDAPLSPADDQRRGDRPRRGRGRRRGEPRPTLRRRSGSRGVLVRPSGTEPLAAA